METFIGWCVGIGIIALIVGFFLSVVNMGIRGGTRRQAEEIAKAKERLKEVEQQKRAEQGGSSV